ncbi:MAG: hypothetical protein ABSG25_02495 [Bryobacteraceae bacterium]|jgi:hypothetical protein
MRKAAFCGWIAIGVAATVSLTGCTSGQSGSAEKPTRTPQAPAAAEILQFYASPGQVAPGEQVLLCYGATNSKAVRIERHPGSPPPIQGTPSWNRCLADHPRRTTAYTLVVTGNDGQEITRGLQVSVSGAPVREEDTSSRIIQFVYSNTNDLAAGEKFTICYGVRDAVSVSLEPVHKNLPALATSCAEVVADRTTVYTLVATNKAGETDRETFKVTAH